MLRCLCGCFSEITAFFFDRGVRYLIFTVLRVDLSKNCSGMSSIYKRGKREERNLLETMKNLFWKQD